MGAISYRHYSMGHDEYEQNLNKSVSAFLTFMVNEGYITTDQYEDLYNNYAIILKKPNFFGQMWDKITKKNSLQYVVVKQMNLFLPEDSPEEKKGAVLSLVKDENKEESKEDKDE